METKIVEKEKIKSFIHENNEGVKTADFSSITVIKTLHPVFTDGKFGQDGEMSECKDVFRQNDEIKSITCKEFKII